jgi:hypothetical protein
LAIALKKSVRPYNKSIPGGYCTCRGFFVGSGYPLSTKNTRAMTPVIQRRLLPAILMTIVVPFLLGFLQDSVPLTIPSDGEWEKLGVHRVTLDEQSDEFNFPANGPVLTAIKIRSKKGSINLQRCAIHFSNGDKKTIELRNDIPPGGESRTINLPGNKHPMVKFVFWYGASQSGAEKAEIEIWGRP